MGLLLDTFYPAPKSSVKIAAPGEQLDIHTVVFSWPGHTALTAVAHTVIPRNYCKPVAWLFVFAQALMYQVFVHVCQCALSGVNVRNVSWSLL